MATLSVLKFNDANQADQVLATLGELQKQQLIRVIDAAVVRWPEGARKPKTQQLINLRGAGAVSGSFWGLLFGVLFFVPVVGLAIGAALGALGGHFTDIGIDDAFINSVKNQVTPGTSALFLMSDGAVADRVVDALKGVDFEVIATNLSSEEEAKLMDMFSEE